MKLKRILVPVDFSACSREALRYAAFLASPFDASIDVLHVWEPLPYLAPETLIRVGSTDQTLAQFARTEAARDMEQFLFELSKLGVENARGRLETGHPARTILEVIAKGDYDLVVMGTHGRTGLSRLVVGSVAEKVVRGAVRPVVTVRHPDLPKEEA